MIHLYRVFLWDGKKVSLDKIFPSQKQQGTGRHDLPEKDTVIYCSQSPVSALAEYIQIFRGRVITQDHLTHPCLTRALIKILLSDEIKLTDLNDPDVLKKLKFKPSELATFNRKITQKNALKLYEKNVPGFQWWSTLEATWINVSLFKNRVKEYLIVEEPEPLSIKMPELIEAAGFFNIKIKYDPFFGTKSHPQQM